MQDIILCANSTSSHNLLEFPIRQNILMFWNSEKIILYIPPISLLGFQLILLPLFSTIQLVFLSYDSNDT